jgi:hypothetical protein
MRLMEDLTFMERSAADQNTPPAGTASMEEAVAGRKRKPETARAEIPNIKKYAGHRAVFELRTSKVIFI